VNLNFEKRDGFIRVHGGDWLGRVPPSHCIAESFYTRIGAKRAVTDFENCAEIFGPEMEAVTLSHVKLVGVCLHVADLGIS
jgi:hypothetical protein